MSDFISKVIDLLIAFTIILMALAFKYTSQLMTSQRLVYNEADKFLDMVSDKGFIDSKDLDEFYLQLNSHGLLFDVDVERLVFAPTQDAHGNVVKNYTMVESSEKLGLNSDEEIDFEPNDLIRLRIKEISAPAIRRFTYTLIGMDTGGTNLVLESPVR